MKEMNVGKKYKYWWRRWLKIDDMSVEEEIVCG